MTPHPGWRRWRAKSRGRRHGAAAATEITTAGMCGVCASEVEAEVARLRAALTYIVRRGYTERSRWRVTHSPGHRSPEDQWSEGLISANRGEEGR